MGLESPLSRGPTLAEVLENWGRGQGSLHGGQEGPLATMEAFRP